jgi:hypothetical protein
MILLASPPSSPPLPEELTIRRGSVGLGRSKSVRCNRVKFGLVSLDDDIEQNEDRGAGKGRNNIHLLFLGYLANVLPLHAVLRLTKIYIYI